MSTAEEALTQIRALHWKQTITVYDGTHQGLPYDTCAECGGPDEPWPCATIRVLDAASVDATPAQGVDRDALIRQLDLIPGLSDGPFREGIVEGVVLSPEETGRARDWFSLMSEDVTPDAADRALAARLEAAS